MNKEELEQAFNNTTDNAVSLLKENIELKKRYIIMKENAYSLVKRIDKAIKIYEKRTTCEYKKKRFMENKSTSDLMYEILKGESNE